MKMKKIWSNLSRKWKIGSALIACALIVLVCVGVSYAAKSQNSEAAVLPVSSEGITTESQEIVAEVMDASELEEISSTEYYELEALMDENTENEVYEEEPVSTPQGSETSSSGSQPSDPNPYYIKVNRQSNCVTIYVKDENGNFTVPVKALVCSVGLNGGTPTGVFKTSTKYTWRALYGGVYGQYAYRINGPILFHSVPYYSTNKGQLESEEYNKLGQAASLGCIRLAVRDAKWIMDNCPAGTTVEIYDSADPGPLGKPSATRIDLNSPNRGWDPTDPDPANPWHGSAPTLAGVSDKNVERESGIDLLSGISATDYLGTPLEIHVDGAVNTSVVGNYPITYSVTDSLGNTISQACVFHVIDTVGPTVQVANGIRVSDNDKANVSSKILANISAKDGSVTLDASAITLDVSQLTAAMSNYSYGNITCSAKAVDGSGNVSAPVSFTVTYFDQTAPEIRVQDSFTANLVAPSNDNATISSNAQALAETTVKNATSVSDTSPQNLSTSFVTTETGRTNVEETELPACITYQVSITATDCFGNTSSKNVTCIVSISYN